MKIFHYFRRLAYRLSTISVPRIVHEIQELRSQGFYSQYGQDKFIAEKFGYKTNGVFLEIGAFDGVTLSNTYYFEKKLHWTGVLIEPSPNSFARCKNNRSCIAVNGCIASQSDLVTFLEIDGPAAMLSGIVNNYDDKHIQRIDKEINELGGSKKEISVPCFTAIEVLNNHRFDHVDYISIDTEGGELDILTSIDFTDLSVKYVTVENNYSDLRLRKHMNCVGFNLIAIMGSDEIYEKK